MRWIGSLVVIFILVVAVLGAYYLYEKKSQEYDYEEFMNNYSWAPAENKGQFYPNMRFADSEVTYFIEKNCSADKIRDIKNALTILSQGNFIRFNEIPEHSTSPNIFYICSIPAPPSSGERQFVAGEGGPVGIINLSYQNLIILSKVYLYNYKECSTPNVVLHETLHALGFDHVDDKDNILYPIAECEQTVGSGTMQRISELYQKEASPDLIINEVRANGTGDYLNFDIKISNMGLKLASSTMLKVFSDSKLLGEYEDFGNVEPGMKKSLSVQNMKTGGGIKVIRFLVVSDEDDSSMADNQAEINLNYIT